MVNSKNMIKKPKIVVLIATMFNNNIDTMLEEMKIKSDCIVVNQCDCKKETIINKNGIYENKIVIINTNDRGLSRSRNKALENVSNDTDIIIFTDDDIEFSDDYVEKISTAYENNKKCDGIIFNVKRVSGRLNKKLGKKINQFNLLRVCSVSISMRYKSIKNVRFDENFGAGSGKYCLGEENIFISDCLKNKLNIITDSYIMCNICDKRPSTWYRGMNKDVLISKGASFGRMHKYIYWIYCIYFAIFKYKKYKENFGIITGMRLLFNSARDYKKRG